MRPDQKLSPPTQMPFQPALFFLIVLSFFALGCSTDSNVRKQKFLARANHDFDQGKYAEALISYGRAIQIDARSREALFGLAQTHLKMGSWTGARAKAEFERVINLNPKSSVAEQARRSLNELAGS